MRISDWSSDVCSSDLAGVVSLSGGDIISVINPSAMLRVAAEVPRRLSATPVAAPQESHAPLILVVDDSITTRTLERSILEAMGYWVKLGVDGRNALSLLVEEMPDLVISDIEKIGRASWRERVCQSV